MKLPQYSLGEEIANSVIHGIGFLLSLGIIGVLSAFSALYGDAWHITGCSIFALTMAILYLSSTLYHSIPSYKCKKVLRIIDHSAIFLLIAGTFSPFMLVNLKGPWGWTILAVVWAIAIFGIAFQSFIIKKKIFSVLLYLIMGWIIVIPVKLLISNVEKGGLILLLIGGLFYSVGIIFYLWKKLPYNHAIWHAFVLFGTLFHFFSILFYVIPIASNTA